MALITDFQREPLDVVAYRGEIGPVASCDESDVISSIDDVDTVASLDRVDIMASLDGVEEPKWSLRARGLTIVGASLASWAVVLGVVYLVVLAVRG